MMRVALFPQFQLFVPTLCRGEPPVTDVALRTPTKQGTERLKDWNMSLQGLLLQVFLANRKWLPIASHSIEEFTGLLGFDGVCISFPGFGNARPF